MRWASGARIPVAKVLYSALAMYQTMYSVHGGLSPQAALTS